MKNVNSELFPLLFANEGDTVIVKELRGGRRFVDNCINQGIVPGQKITILNNMKQGPCILEINDSRIMLGHGILNRVIVQK